MFLKTLILRSCLIRTVHQSPGASCDTRLHLLNATLFLRATFGLLLVKPPASKNNLRCRLKWTFSLIDGLLGTFGNNLKNAIWRHFSYTMMAFHFVCQNRNPNSCASPNSNKQHLGHVSIFCSNEIFLESSCCHDTLFLHHQIPVD